MEHPDRICTANINLGFQQGAIKQMLLMRRPIFLTLLMALLVGCASKPVTQTPPDDTLDELAPMIPATAETPDPLLEEGRSETPPEASVPVEPDHADLWNRIRAGFSLDLTKNNARITAQRNWYARNQEYLDRVATRGERYLYYIVEQAEQRDMPLELVLLPIVESAFDPFAYSHGRAAGPWQFIESTGRAFGMEQDFWHDGRRDIIASTDAALDYLQRLADRFDGDWLLALASYNAGAGNVSRAIRRNERAGRPTDYWSLRLPRETMAYVPKLIGLAQIVASPADYDISLKPLADEPYFRIVDIGGQLDLTLAAELADVSVDELYMLNPHLNQWATPATGPHRMLVPKSHAEGFRKNLSSLDDTQRMRWTEYRIRSGDSLIKIAQRFNTTVKSLRDINQLRGNTIIAGHTLLIPTARQDSEAYSLSADARLEARQNRTVNGRSRTTYQTRPGDSLWKIARHYKVSVRELASWNGMAPGDTLQIGQNLAVWTERPLATAAVIEGQPNMIRRINYPVRRGDSLHRIANRFKVSVNDIQRWNRIDPNRYLHPGQQITLYVDVRNAH